MHTRRIYCDHIVSGGAFLPAYGTYTAQAWVYVYIPVRNSQSRCQRSGCRRYLLVSAKDLPMVPHSNSHYQWPKVSGLQGAASYDGKAVTATGPHLVSRELNSIKHKNGVWGWRMTAGIATLQNTSRESESEFSLVPSSLKTSYNKVHILCALCMLLQKETRGWSYHFIPKATYTPTQPCRCR